MNRCTIFPKSVRDMGSIFSATSLCGVKNDLSFLFCSSGFFDFLDIYPYGTRFQGLKKTVEKHP
jgi:hypothetical protein